MVLDCARLQVLPRLLPATSSPDPFPMSASKGRSSTSVSSVSSDKGRASTGRSCTSVSSVSSGRASTGGAGKVGVGEGGGRGTRDDDLSERRRERCHLCLQAGVDGLGAHHSAEDSSLPPWCRPSSSKHMVMLVDLHGFGIADMDPRVGLKAIPIILSHYPDRIAQVSDCV